MRQTHSEAHLSAKVPNRQAPENQPIARETRNEPATRACVHRCKCSTHPGARCRVCETCADCGEALPPIAAPRGSTFEERLRWRIETNGVDELATEFRHLTEHVTVLMAVASEADNISPAELAPVLAAREQCKTSLEELREILRRRGVQA